MKTIDKTFYNFMPILASTAEAMAYYEYWKEDFARKEIEKAFEEVQTKDNVSLDSFHALKELVDEIARLYKNKDISNADFCENVFNKLKTLQESFKEINLFALTKNELLHLGFGNYNDTLLLIPLYLLPAIPNGTVVTCIFDKTYVIGTGQQPMTEVTGLQKPMILV